MKEHGVKIEYDCSLFFLHKKHYCQKCKNVLVKKKREKLVNSNSDESKDYDFSLGDSFLVGNINFITYYFECPECEIVYEIKELKELEKMKRKRK